MARRKSAETKRAHGRETELDEGIAFAAAAVLGQLYRWRPGLKLPREVRPEPGPFDVRAAFDALSQR